MSFKFLGQLSQELKGIVKSEDNWFLFWRIDGHFVVIQMKVLVIW